MASRFLAFALAGVSALLAFGADGGSAWAIVALEVVALTMILRPRWWTFWLPFGFWETFARDRQLADRQGPAIVFLGWVVLAGLLLVVLWR